jgi:hypothetical protein
LIRYVFTRLVVLAGCLSIGSIALYPPRRERLHAVSIPDRGTQVEVFRYRIDGKSDMDRTIPRIWLFSDKPHYTSIPSGGFVLTEIDTGRLLAEALLVFALTGAVVAALTLRLPTSNPYMASIVKSAHPERHRFS